MNTWQTILSSAGISAFLSAGLVFFLREWISTRIRNSILFEYKTKEEKLKFKLQGELEGTKAGYKKVLDENQIRFSKLHAEQAEVLKELYQRLTALQANVKATITLPKFGHTEDSYHQEFNQASEAVDAQYDECRAHFLRNRLVLPESLAKSVEIFLQDTWTDFELFAAHNDQECLNESGPEERTMAGQERQRARGSIYRDNQELFREIEREFRRLLGIPDVESVEDVDYE